MTIIRENLIIGADLTNDEPSANYPVENLVHPFLEKRYQPTAGETTDVVYLPLTGDGVSWSWDRLYLFLGHLRNVGYVSVEAEGTTTIGGAWQTEKDVVTAYAASATERDRITDGGDTRITDAGDTRSVLAVKIFLATLYDGDPKVWTVDAEFHPAWVEYRIKLRIIYTTTGGYIGGASAGEGLEISRFLSGYDLPLQDNSIYTESAGGHTLQVPQAVLREHDFIIPELTLAEKDDIVAVYESYRAGAPFFMTVFNVGVEDIQPLYAKFIKPPDVSKSGRRFNIKLQFREAR